MANISVYYGIQDYDYEGEIVVCDYANDPSDIPATASFVRLGNHDQGQNYDHIIYRLHNYPFYFPEDASYLFANGDGRTGVMASYDIIDSRYCKNFSYLFYNAHHIKDLGRGYTGGDIIQSLNLLEATTTEGMFKNFKFSDTVSAAYRNLSVIGSYGHYNITNAKEMFCNVENVNSIYFTFMGYDFSKITNLDRMFYNTKVETDIRGELDGNTSDFHGSSVDMFTGAETQHANIGANSYTDIRRANLNDYHDKSKNGFFYYDQSSPTIGNIPDVYEKNDNGTKIDKVFYKSNNTGNQYYIRLNIKEQ